MSNVELNHLILRLDQAGDDVSWKFKQEYVKDGDVIEPSELRINLNEMYSELNGFLDSDNIGRDQISIDLVKRNSFTEIVSNDIDPTYSYIFNHTRGGWMKSAGGCQTEDLYLPFMWAHPVSIGAKYGVTDQPSDGQLVNYVENFVNSEINLPSATFTPNQDGLLICEFSGWVNWMPQSTHPNEVDRQLNDTLPNKPVSSDAGLLPEYRYSQYGFFAKQNKTFKHLSAYVLCSMWRLTVNGQSVAETGPLGNEYQSHPIYLCGTTPVLKNEETVVQLEAQFVWYSMGSDDYVQASGFNPRSKVLDQKSYRSDCSLHSPSLIVTYRKR